MPKPISASLAPPSTQSHSPQTAAPKKAAFGKAIAATKSLTRCFTPQTSDSRRSATSVFAQAAQPKAVDQDRRRSLEVLAENLKQLEAALDSGRQVAPKIAIGADRRNLPDLVQMANEKKPGLNLHYCDTHAEVADKLAEFAANNAPQARVMATLAKPFTHYVALDFRMVGNKPSIIAIEPARMHALGPGMMGQALKLTLSDKLPDAVLTLIETDLQRSPSECGMYSLALSKKMHKEAEHFDQLHAQNVANGQLPDGKQTDVLPPVIKARDSDKYLPPSMMKHVQSETRLKTYLDHRPEARETIVNKKGETLPQRQSRFMQDVSVDERTCHVSTSIENKRIGELTKLAQKRQQDQA